LGFLLPYAGPTVSMLTRILRDRQEDLSLDVREGARGIEVA
jgi:hypothetical protein